LATLVSLTNTPLIKISGETDSPEAMRNGTQAFQKPEYSVRIGRSISSGRSGLLQCEVAAVN
jgi:hypothetical protein